VVLHATEGVWGLACDPWQMDAVRKILLLKKRRADQGLIVIGASARCFERQLTQMDERRRAEILNSWPGPHTWVLPDDSYPAIVRGYRDTLACRVPGHAQARALCAAYGGTLVSTSANEAGQPAITSAAEAERQFADRVDYLLPGEVQDPGRASTIHGLGGEILR